MPKHTKFQVFAAKLADAVCLTHLKGYNIMPCGTGDYCPLGCLPGAKAANPMPWEIEGMASRDARSFIEAFDDRIDNETKYAKLGLAYRAWSDKKSNA